MQDLVKILFIGDIVGRPGRIAVRECLPRLVGDLAPDIVVANGENAAGGFGITPDIAEELFKLGVDVITSGNHIWDKKEIYDYIRSEKKLLRPANYPEGAPGAGSVLFECASGAKVGIVNLLGRVFMESVDCPFRAGRSLVQRLKAETPVVMVDMHAETTSEKTALAWHLDGMASAVIGTHTHVQTSDERVLPGGTAFIADAGMTGPTESVIGIKREIVVERFVTQMPVRFELAGRGVELQGAFMEVESSAGRAISIKRIKVELKEKE